jgi:hypothetical protein
MKIKLRKVAMYTDVKVEVNDTTVELGFHNGDERKELLKSLQEQIIAELTSDDKEWWIESITDEVARMGYGLVEDE